MFVYLIIWCSRHLVVKTYFVWQYLNPFVIQIVLRTISHPIIFTCRIAYLLLFHSSYVFNRLICSMCSRLLHNKLHSSSRIVSSVCNFHAAFITSSTFSFIKFSMSIYNFICQFTLSFVCSQFCIPGIICISLDWNYSLNLIPDESDLPDGSWFPSTVFRPGLRRNLNSRTSAIRIAKVS